MNDPQTFATVVATLVMLIGSLITWLKQHRDDRREQRALRVSRYAVNAIEVFNHDKNGNPYMKRQDAIAAAQALGKRLGLRLSDAEWDTLIHTALYEMKVANQELTDTPPASQE